MLYCRVSLRACRLHFSVLTNFTFSNAWVISQTLNIFRFGFCAREGFSSFPGAFFMDIGLGGFYIFPQKTSVNNRGTFIGRCPNGECGTLRYFLGVLLRDSVPRAGVWVSHGLRNVAPREMVKVVWWSCIVFWPRYFLPTMNCISSTMPVFSAMLLWSQPWTDWIFIKCKWRKTFLPALCVTGMDFSNPCHMNRLRTIKREREWEE